MLFGFASLNIHIIKVPNQQLVGWALLWYCRLESNFSNFKFRESFWKLFTPLQYKIPFWISVYLMSLTDQTFRLSSSSRETLPVAESVPPPVGSSSMSTGHASSSLTPVLSGSARVLKHTHGCGVWSGERFKDTQSQTLHSTPSLCLYCFDPPAH